MRNIKITALALLTAATALTVHAQDDLLQALSVSFTIYTQGTPISNSSGGTNNVVDKQSFGTKDLIAAVTGNAFTNGELLVRVTPTPILVTNITAIGSTNLILTNISTSTEIVSNALLFDGTSNYIGATNITFGTNIVDIGGTNVTVGTNSVTAGTNATLSSGTVNPFPIGTNTTMTVSNITNASGYVVGTNYTITTNALTVITNIKTGDGWWGTYNTKTKAGPTPISTNVHFSVTTEDVYADTNNIAAYVHGETVRKNGEINFGTTDAIRTLVLSNSTMQIRLRGYAKGHLVAVSLTSPPTAGSTVYSQDYIWDAAGSGISNAVPVTPLVVEGGVVEAFYKLHK